MFSWVLFLIKKFKYYKIFGQTNFSPILKIYNEKEVFEHSTYPRRKANNV